MRTISYTLEQQTLIFDWPIDMPWPGSEMFDGFAQLMREPRSLQPSSRLTLREVWLFALKAKLGQRPSVNC